MPRTDQDSAWEYFFFFFFFFFVGYGPTGTPWFEGLLDLNRGAHGVCGGEPAATPQRRCSATWTVTRTWATSAQPHEGQAKVRSELHH